MYKIIGGDEREYGPVDITQLQNWVVDGRLNAQSKVKEENATEWKRAGELPELREALARQSRGGPVIPPPVSHAPPPSEAQQKGLAVTSFILGLLSIVCFFFLAGIPAIICGHVAHGRARRSPGQYGGAGFALAGLVMGYVSIILTVLILPAMLLPALSRAKARAQSINCVNHMKTIGLAFRTWALDNQNNFPFNVSTNAGGTMELSAPAADGFEANPVPTFQVMSNELGTPAILVCVADSSKTPAADFRNLQLSNVSYRLRTGKNVSDSNPQQVLAICPIHQHQLLCDGSVIQKTPRSRVPTPE